MSKLVTCDGCGYQRTNIISEKMIELRADGASKLELDLCTSCWPKMLAAVGISDTGDLLHNAAELGANYHERINRKFREAFGTVGEPESKDPGLGCD